MKVQIGNALYGIGDYLVQPVGMLIATPLLLHRLGLASYGIWLIASAAIGAGSIISSGFGDVVIQRIATLRGADDQQQMRRIVSNVLTINLSLSLLLSTVLCLLAPTAAGHITRNNPGLYYDCLWSLRLGAVLIVIKAVEAVFIAAQRAFESYSAAVRVSVATRLLTLATAVVLATNGFSPPAIMTATVIINAAGTVRQWKALRRHMSTGTWMPALDLKLLRSLASFGGFSWLQAVCGVIFSQADRLLVGATLGASAVACYGICVQVAQPIHGLTAAGLHFLFPHLSARVGVNPANIRPLFLKILGINLVLAVLLTCLAATLGVWVIRSWLGSSIADQAATALPIIAIGFGLLAINVTGHYTLLALGRVKLVAALNLGGGSLMLFAMSLLWKSHGIEGTAVARLCYGPVTLLIYLPLFRILQKRTPLMAHPSGIAMEEA